MVCEVDLFACPVAQPPSRHIDALGQVGQPGEATLNGRVQFVFYLKTESLDFVGTVPLWPGPASVMDGSVFPLSAGWGPPANSSKVWVWISGKDKMKNVEPGARHGRWGQYQAQSMVPSMIDGTLSLVEPKPPLHQL